MDLIHFNCRASKIAFIKQNKISSLEVISQTDASLILKSSGFQWENNVFVYSVERV